MKPAKENSLLRQWNGPLTEDLVLRPGEFGLGQVPARLKPEATTRSVCGFCSTGCSLDVHLKDGVAVNLSPTRHYPVNLGMACPKGWEALTPLSAPDRGTTPLIKGRDGKLHAANWEKAMQLFTDTFKRIMAEYGPESVAFLSTGQICTEEMALLGALWKFGIGAVHCDSNTRQCMATAHTAYKQSFGFDAPPFTYADFEESDVLVFIGANPCIAHPIMWQRVMRNKHSPAIIVVDPRKTETAMAATQHVALKPKSDLTLLYGMANRLIELGAVKREFVDAHTMGFDEFAQFVQQFSGDFVCAESGLTREEFEEFAVTIVNGRRVSFWWTMGVNQGHEATRTAQAVINLALMTGNIGRPGTGANSITGQCNAMGSRIFSNITGLFGGRDFVKAEHRAEIARLLGIPEANIPAQNSLAYDQIVDSIRDGRIKGLWVIGTNSSHSWIHQGAFNDILATLDFLVVQDMYPTTETAQRADLFLPAAGWGEKDGTLINSERRIGLVKKVSRAPGLSLSDFNIFRLVANSWGCGELLRGWDSPQAVFQIIKKLSAKQPCDITGIEDYQMIDAWGGIQWPFTESQNAECRMQRGGERGDSSSLFIPHSSFKERRLFADGKFFHADGKAIFLFDRPRAVAEPVDEEFPFVLLTGRGTSAQWHTGSRTNKSDVLRSLAPQDCYVEINPADAERLGIAPQARVRVSSRRGGLVASAFVTGTVSPGQIFIPMHYAELNKLTRADFDPHSRQPSYKYSVARVELASEKKILADAKVVVLPSVPWRIDDVCETVE